MFIELSGICPSPRSNLICREFVEGAGAELRLRLLRVDREEGQPRRPRDPNRVPLVQLQGEFRSGKR